MARATVRRKACLGVQLQLTDLRAVLFAWPGMLQAGLECLKIAMNIGEQCDDQGTSSVMPGTI